MIPAADTTEKASIYRITIYLDYELDNVFNYNYSNLKRIRRDLITIIHNLCCFAHKKQWR